jgi:hypothetical protein
MHATRAALLITGTALLLAGCAAQQIADQESLLAAAGFTAKPADTPAREASLRALPPGRLVLVTRNDRSVWMFADPMNCHCLYVGGPTDYQRYAQLKVRQRIAETRLQAAQLEQMNWGWGVWGPWPPYAPWGPPFIY